MTNSSLYIPGAVLLGIGILIIIVFLVVVLLYKKIKVQKWAKITFALIGGALIIAGAVLLGVGLSSSSDNETTITINKIVPAFTSILFYVNQNESINYVDVHGLHVIGQSDYPNVYTYPVSGTGLIPLSDDDIRLLNLATPSVDITNFRKERRSVDVFFNSGNSVLGDIVTYYDAESVPQKQYANFHFTGNLGENANIFTVSATGKGTTINYVV